MTAVSDERPLLASTRETDAPIHALLIASSASDGDTIVRNTNASGVATIRYAGSWSDVEDALAEDWPDVVLVHGLGSDGPVAIVNRIRSRWPEPPEAVCIGWSDPHSILKAVRAGYRDFLSSPAAGTREIADVLNRATLQRRSRRRMRARLERFAADIERDFETGLPNERFFVKRVDELIKSLRAAHQSFAIIVLKNISMGDLSVRYGLRIAEKVHVAVARRISKETRASELFAALDGHAFGLILQRNAAGDAVGKAGRRLAAIGCKPIELDEVSTEVVSNWGAALFPTDGNTAIELLAVARARLEESAVAPVNDVAAGPPSTSVVTAEAGDSSEQATRGSRERREHRRRRVYRKATLEANRLGQVVPCIIKDVSWGGSRVTVPAPIMLPEKLDLNLGERERISVIRCWQRGTDVGLRFEAQQDQLRKSERLVRLISDDDAGMVGVF